MCKESIGIQVSEDSLDRIWLGAALGKDLFTSYFALVYM